MRPSKKNIFIVCSFLLLIVFLLYSRYSTKEIAHAKKHAITNDMALKYCRPAKNALFSVEINPDTSSYVLILERHHDSTFFRSCFIDNQNTIAQINKAFDFKRKLFRGRCNIDYCLYLIHNNEVVDYIFIPILECSGYMTFNGIIDYYCTGLLDVYHKNIADIKMLNDTIIKVSNMNELHEFEQVELKNKKIIFSHFYFYSDLLTMPYSVSHFAKYEFKKSEIAKRSETMRAYLKENFPNEKYYIYDYQKNQTDSKGLIILYCNQFLYDNFRLFKESTDTIKKLSCRILYTD